MRPLGCLAFAVVLGCGGSPPPTTSTPGGDPREGGGSKGSGLTYSSEIGAMDEGKVQQTFDKASSKLTACFSSGTRRIPYLSGSVSFKVRVAEDGSVRWAYLKDSTLGDRTTEDCMLGVLKSASWPKPVGGEGLAGNDNVSFDPGGDERAPVDWSPEQLGDPWKKAKPALSQCRSAAGTGPIKATLYVETDGKPKSIGVSTSDEKGEAAVKCVLDTLNEIKFPSPGSYASKVSVVIE